MSRLARWIDRWRKKPRFRTAGAGVVPGVLLLILLLLLHREPVPSKPRALPAPAPPAIPKVEPPLVQAPPDPPAPKPAEPIQEGCPEGCEVPPAGCDIKGNISQKTGERIYHVPGQRWYDETKITPGKGEAWFCTEAEARANGWRKSRV